VATYQNRPTKFMLKYHTVSCHNETRQSKRAAWCVWMCLLITSQGCIAVHYRNPVRQALEYRSVTRRIGSDRIKPLHEKTLSYNEVGTDKATLQGIFVGKRDGGTRGHKIVVASQNMNQMEFSEREQVPYELDADLIFDEATLVSYQPRTCVDLVIRSDALYDLPLKELGLTMEVDSQEVEFTLEQEHEVPPISLWYSKRFYLFWTHEEVFDQKRRTGRVCADVRARDVVSLNVSHDLYSVRLGELWRQKFRWFLGGLPDV